MDTIDLAIALVVVDQETNDNFNGRIASVAIDESNRAKNSEWTTNSMMVIIKASIPEAEGIFNSFLIQSRTVRPPTS